MLVTISEITVQQVVATACHLFCGWKVLRLEGFAVGRFCGWKVLRLEEHENHILR
jgi:hypothetical protein